MQQQQQRTLDTITLSTGSHQNIGDGACLLELTSWLADEPWSDQPRCVSPVLAAFGRNLNDHLFADHLADLKPFAPRLIGTAGHRDIDQQAAYLLADWALRDITPHALDVIGLTDHAATLRALAPVVDRESARTAKEAYRAAAASAASSAADAAYAASYASAAAAAAAAASDYAASAADAAYAAHAASAAAAAAAAAAKRTTIDSATIRQSALDVFNRALALYPTFTAPDVASATTRP